MQQAPPADALQLQQLAEAVQQQQRFIREKLATPATPAEQAYFMAQLQVRRLDGAGAQEELLGRHMACGCG